MQNPTLKIDKIIVALCACYLAVLPVGLPHLVFVLGFMYLLCKAGRGMVSIQILWLAIFIVFGAFQLWIGADWKGMVNNISSMALFPITYEALRNKKENDIVNNGIQFIKTTVWLMVFETIIRYAMAMVMPLGAGFYRFKFHSFMFQDTNFAGLVLLVVIFFAKYLIGFQKVKHIRIYYVAAIILLFLTVSRAAILAYILGEIVFWRISPLKFNRQMTCRFIVLGVLGVFGGTAVYLWLYEDPSFKSKLYIFELAENTYSELGSIKYIGVGYDNSEKFLGIYAHNVLFLYFIETGILGMLLKGAFLLYIMIKSNWRALMIFFPFFIAAQSAVGYGVHYLYVIFAVVVLLSKKQNINERNRLCYN